MSNTMKKFVISALLFSLIGGGAYAQKKASAHGYPIDPVPFTSVKLTDSFWGQRLKASREVTIPLAFSKCEETGRYKNFEMAAHPSENNKVTGYSFDDTDVYKTIEGASYLLQTYPDKKLKKYIDSVLVIVAAAQEPDGYLYTSRTMNPKHPHEWAGSKRWEKVEELSHEFYNLGHMVEGAIAHYQATGQRNFLDIAIRYADCVCREIGDKPGQQVRVPGHQIAEMALAKLYLVTGDQKYLDQAKFFLDKRGYTSRRDEYSQAHKPVIEQDEAVGHAVRAAYMYSGMADVAALKNDTGYIAAMDRLWDDVVHRNMYITGGIGSSRDNEGFTEDYDLPNLDAYCETCASVGMVLWNQRMNQLTGDSKYIDVLERSLYNGALAGISLGGDRFFYVNPLESKGDHHRQEWYGCACCPSQLSRFLPSIGNYIYASSDDALWVNLYIGNTGQIRIGETDILLTQETDYPWDGSVKLTISTSQPLEKEIRLRIPDWCKTYDLSINGKRINVPKEKGYAVIKDWKSQDVIALDMDMPVEIVAADPHVKENFDKRAIQRGPLVYCMEEIDNPVYFDQIQLSPSTTFQTAFASDILNGIKTIKTNGRAQSATFIPYYAWDNRKAGKMRVWIPYNE